MKKLLLTLFMATLSAISFAQANYGKYSMQHSTSEADLQQYIGQHVKLMPYNGFSLYSNNGHDEYIFKSKLGGTVGTIYKVEKNKSWQTNYIRAF